MSQNQGRRESAGLSLKEDAESAFKRIAAACPEDAQVLGQYLAALHKKSVVALGEGEAFVLRDGDGRAIKATKRIVHLDAANGGLTQPVYQGPYVISAPGYAMLAHASGAVCMNAPTVTVDGEVQQNPYVRRGKDGSIVEVYCRAVAFRYNEQGAPTVSDRTTIFDTATYMMVDLVGKARRNAEVFRMLPAGMEPPGKREEWACYRLDESINLWMKISHKEAITFISNVLNRKKKAMEFAQTFAQRNALKHLFGIAAVPGQSENNPISHWDVPVVCWMPQDGGLIRFDMARYASATDTIDALTQGQSVALPEAHQPIVISRGTDQVNGGELDEMTDPEDNPGRYEPQADALPEPPQAAAAQTEPDATTADGEEMPDSTRPADEPAWTQEQMGAWKNLQVAREEFPVEYDKALRQCNLTDNQVNPGNAAAVNRIIDRMVI
ncbi:MAG: hypothetical protein J5960_04235 [Desulfovibrio sp.]|nr:hypothetical protein [Desulfovibrio sp.]